MLRTPTHITVQFVTASLPVTWGGVLATDAMTQGFLASRLARLSLVPKAAGSSADQCRLKKIDNKQSFSKNRFLRL